MYIQTYVHTYVHMYVPMMYNYDFANEIKSIFSEENQNQIKRFLKRESYRNLKICTPDINLLLYVIYTRL
jgi:hypothetical protein